MVEQIPADVASAISTVMAGVKTLGRDGENRHQRYNFVSTDAFLAALNPLCAAAGLIILQDEESVSIATTETADDYGKVKARTWLTARYSFILAHKGGATWGPISRSVMVQANGAQAFGSAQSYALKQFMRSLFQISTGEQDDADHQAAEPLPTRQVANQQNRPGPTQDHPAPAPRPAAALRADARPPIRVDVEEISRAMTERLADTADEAALNALWSDNDDVLREMREHRPKAYAALVEAFKARKVKLTARPAAPAEPGDRDPDPLPERPRTVEVPVAPDGEPAWGVFADHLLDIIPRVRSRRWGEAFLDLHKGQIARLGAVRGIVGTFDGKEMSGTTVAAAIRGRMQIHLDAIDPPRAPDVAAE